MNDALWTGLEILGALGARAHGGLPDTISGVSIDTRTIAPGDLFCALAGNRDGHEFVADALAKGAAAALVDEAHFEALSHLGPLLVVPDVLEAMRAAARAARARTKARIVAVESTDEGRTWGPRRVLQENSDGMNAMSASLFRLLPNAVHDGPIGFLYLKKNSYTDLHAFLRVSDDEGMGFGPPIEATPAAGYHVVNNDRVTVLSTGRLVVPTSSTPDVGKGAHFVASCFLSDDRGRTWRRSRTTLDYAKRGAMEPELIEREDGSLLMHIRTQVGHIAVSESADGGETWSEAKSWGVTAPEAPSTLRKIPSTGDWLLVWNDSVKAGEGHGGPRTPLSAAVSSDEGRTWSRPVTIEGDPQNTYAYTSLTFHRGRALLTYYRGPASWQRLNSRFRSIPIGRFYGPGEK